MGAGAGLPAELRKRPDASESSFSPRWSREPWGAPGGVLSLVPHGLPGCGEQGVREGHTRVLLKPWSRGGVLGILNWVIFHLLLPPFFPFPAFCGILPGGTGGSRVRNRGDTGIGDGVLAAAWGHWQWHGVGHRASANPLFSSLLTRHRSEAGHDQEKPNPDAFALAAAQDPAKRVQEECGCWRGRGGGGGAALRTHQVLVATTVTPARAQQGLVRAMLAGAPCLLLYPLGAARESPAWGGDTGWAVTQCHQSWGC